MSPTTHKYEIRTSFDYDRYGGKTPNGCYVVWDGSAFMAKFDSIAEAESAYPGAMLLAEFNRTGVDVISMHQARLAAEDMTMRRGTPPVIDWDD